MCFKLKLSLNLNAAAVAIKQKSWATARKSSQKALDIESSNEKALYRHAQASMELQEYDESRRSLGKILDGDAEHAEAQRMLARLKVLEAHQAKKDAAEAERQPASAVTTSPSAGWTCASARPRTAVATLPSCRSLRRALQPRRVRVRLPSLLAWLRTAPQSTPSSISTSTSTRATFSKSSTRPAAPARL